ncbi:MAG: hypothetical protein NTV19_21565 [Burkholderiales bacterium]|nr:hypothetical protein [Burkholderiales bacterium]
MSEPQVKCIRVEYVDGSVDEIENLPGANMPLYNLRRKRGCADMNELGMHTGTAVAGLLFLTASTTLRREYSSVDPEMYWLVTGGKENQ